MTNNELTILFFVVTMALSIYVGRQAIMATKNYIIIIRAESIRSYTKINQTLSQAANLTSIEDRSSDLTEIERALASAVNKLPTQIASVVIGGLVLLIETVFFMNFL